MPKVRKITKKSVDVSVVVSADSAAVLVDTIGDYEAGGYSETY